MEDIAICSKIEVYLCMSSPDLFLHRITLIMMIAMSVIPATAAITIQRVLFFSAPPVCASALGPSGVGEVNAARQTSKNVWFVFAH